MQRCVECKDVLNPVRVTFLTRLVTFLELHNSPADWARELSKPSTDSASLLLEIENKNVFRFRFGVRWGDRHKWGCFCFFLAAFTFPWTSTHWPIILAQVFLETRPNSASLEPLNGFLAVAEIMDKKQKLVKISAPTNPNVGCKTTLFCMAINPQQIELESCSNPFWMGEDL